MKKLIIAVAAVAISTSAMAWGPREQGALTGLVIGAVVASQYDAPEPRYQRRQEPVYVQPQPVYIQPQPQICGYNVYCGPIACFNEPIHNQWNQIIGYRQVCR